MKKKIKKFQNRSAKSRVLRAAYKNALNDPGRKELIDDWSVLDGFDWENTGCKRSHIPNKKTVESLENVEKSRNLFESCDLEGFLNALGL